MLAGAAALAAGAVAPWLVGFATEEQWQQATHELNLSQPLIELTTARYDRGYLGAELQGQLMVESPSTGESVAIPYVAEVSHGILGSQLRFSIEPAFAKASAELFPEEKPSLVVDTRLWGTVLVELNVPAVNVDDPETGESLTMAESYGWGEISDGGRKVDLELRWPGLAVRAPGMRIGMDDLQFSQSMTRIQGNVWTGEGAIEMARLELVDDARPEVVLEHLSLTSEATAQDEDRRITSRSVLVLENLAVDQQDIGPHRVAFELVGAEVDSWNRFTEVLGRLHSFAPEAASLAPQELMERQMQLMSEVTEAIRQLAGHGVSFGVPELSLQTPAGAVTGALEIRHPRLSDDERQQMLMVMQQLSGDLEFSLPAELMERYPRLRAQLQPMLDQGLLVLDGDRYRLEAHFEELEAEINGEMMPLPPMI